MKATRGLLNPISRQSGGCHGFTVLGVSQNLQALLRSFPDSHAKDIGEGISSGEDEPVIAAPFISITFSNSEAHRDTLPGKRKQQQQSIRIHTMCFAWYLHLQFEQTYHHGLFH